jgi:hypothetical protein
VFKLYRLIKRLVKSTFRKRSVTTLLFWVLPLTAAGHFSYKPHYTLALLQKWLGVFLKLAATASSGLKAMI